MKKTYMQPETAIENMELEEMIAATGVNLSSTGEVESIDGGSDLSETGVILSRTMSWLVNE